jgi:uncharacterized membrane protein YeiH
LLHALDYAGTAVFAVSGVLAAGRKSLDLLGVVVIAMVTAIGGGTLRDLMLDRTPFWFTDTGYLITILVSAAATILLLRWRYPSERWLQVADALGLAMFSISGAQIAERAGLPGIIVVVLATITGTVGGITRDVLCNEIPLLLRRGNIYGTAVIAGASIYVLLQGWGVERVISTAVGMITIAGLRLAAIAFGLTLPVLTIDARTDDDRGER